MNNIFKKKKEHNILIRYDERERLLLGCCYAQLRGAGDILAIKMVNLNDTVYYLYSIICTDEQFNIIKDHCDLNEVEAK